MQVIATLRGFDGLKIREPGEMFALPDGSKGTWFQAVGDAPAVEAPTKPVKGKKPPATISEASPDFEDGIA